MTRDLIAGGMYGDNLPSGFFCVLIPKSHCLTHLGLVPLPLGETYGPLFVRCTDVGGFRFAGQAHDSDNPAAYERIGEAWTALPPPCFGVSPLIYDNNGVLHCSNGSVGSQGYRYVNAQNQLISGDATYGPFNGLFEYTYLEDGLWIGQGATDGSGVRVWDGTTLRQLELGDCRFVRANRVNDRVALAFSRPEGVVLIQTTMAELRALLPVGRPVTDKQPGPIVNQPSEVPVSVPNMLSVVQSIRPRYPTPLGARHGAFLVEVAKATGGKLLRKDAGTNVLLPSGVLVSQDILVFANGAECFDILSDGEGAAVPAWSEKGFIPGEYIDVGGIAQPPVQPPTEPPPVVPPVDLAAFVRRMEALEAGLKKAEGDVLRLAVTVDILKAKPAPSLDLDAALAGYEVNGKTTVSGWHQHTVKLAITRKS